MCRLLREPRKRTLARATVATEAEGIASRGLAYILIYCGHVLCGKVDERVQPLLFRPFPGVLRVDAAAGCAHPAKDLGFSALLPAAGEQGIAALSVHNSYNCGVLGYHTSRLASLSWALRTPRPPSRLPARQNPSSETIRSPLPCPVPTTIQPSLSTRVRVPSQKAR